MKKLFVGLVVAALFAPLSFAEEVKKKKKDSFFADVGTPTPFAMAIASTKEGENTCYNQGDIGIDKNGLILSCQSSGSGFEWKNTGSIGLPVKYSVSTNSPKSGQRENSITIENKVFCYLSKNHFKYLDRTNFPGATCAVYALGSGKTWILKATGMDQGVSGCEATCL